MVDRMDRAENRVELQVQKRVTEALSAAGYTGDRIGLELLWMLPERFRVSYGTLFNLALGAADGGADARGRMAEEEARVGKAKRTGGSGGGGSGGKRYRNHWNIRDARLLELKTRVDKRLRQLAREIDMGIEAETGGSGGREKGEDALRCGKCGRIAAREWRFCARCGQKLE